MDTGSWGILAVAMEMPLPHFSADAVVTRMAARHSGFVFIDGATKLPASLCAATEGEEKARGYIFMCPD